MGVAALFAIVYWDATRIEMARPWLWTAVAAGTAAIALGMYLFVLSAPMPANTGSVLYTFEREVSSEE